MTTILCLETATEICSVAVCGDGQLLTLEEIKTPYQHAAQLAVLVDQCLKNLSITFKDLDGIAVSNGPGSFTGLRIGAAAAKGFAYALGIPIVAIDSLKALANGSLDYIRPGKNIIVPMIDARRMEVYTAFYDTSLQIVKENHAFIVEEEAFEKWILEDYSILVTGNGAEKCKPVLTQPGFIFESVQCSAKHLCSLAFDAFTQKTFSDPAYLSPEYLKPPNITTSNKIF